MDSTASKKAKYHARRFVRLHEAMLAEAKDTVKNLRVHVLTGNLMKDIATDCGISEQHLSDLKNGRRDLSVPLARKLAGL